MPDLLDTALDGPDDAEGAPPENVELILSPKDIAINPFLQGLRGADLGSAKFKEGIEALAQTMAEEGQKQTVLVRLNKQKGKQADRPYELVDGHRRLAAAIKGGLELRARFEDLDDDEAFRAAAITEFQKEQFSPLARARMIVTVREKYGLQGDGEGNTKKVAEFLGVSRPIVTETEKLLSLSKDMQAKVEQGLYSGTAALEMVRVKGEEKQAEVARKAEEKAEVEHVTKRAKAEKAKPLSPALKDLKAKHKDRVAKEKAEPVEKPKVQTKHVRAAIKETAGAVDKPKAPNRAEIVAMFEGLAGPTSPKLLLKLAEAWLKWIKGEYGDKQLIAAWDDVADALPASTPAMNDIKQAFKAMKTTATKHDKKQTAGPKKAVVKAKAGKKVVAKGKGKK